MFQFDLPSAILKKRAEKFDSVSLNWHYIELLLKILCIFGLLFLSILCMLYIMYYVCFYLRVNKDEYNIYLRPTRTASAVTIPTVSIPTCQQFIA